MLHRVRPCVKQAISRRQHGSQGRAHRGNVRVAGGRRLRWRMASTRRWHWYWAVQLLFSFCFYIYMFWIKGDYIPFCVVILFSISRLVGILFAGMNSKGVPSVCGGFRPFKRCVALLPVIVCLYGMLRI